MDAGFREFVQPQDVGSYKNIFLRFMAYKHGRPVSFTCMGISPMPWFFEKANALTTLTIKHQHTHRLQP
jgi:hypothetical protein